MSRLASEYDAQNPSDRIFQSLEEYGAGAGVTLRHFDPLPVQFLCGTSLRPTTAATPWWRTRSVTSKACGLRNFPFEDFVRNEAWLVMVMVAQDLLAWTAMLCLDGALSRAEPATLR